MSSSRQPQPRRSSGRTLLACEPCRKRKSKCDGEKPQCGSCRSHELACHYEPARTTRRYGPLFSYLRPIYLVPKTQHEATRMYM
ncbi:hypothetical protein J3E68DRAFT_414123 [Trichoderma sp. SZMC 28012]